MVGGPNSTPIGSVGKDSPLVQAYEEDSEGKVKVRLAAKIAGLQTLCRMTGWNEPDQVRLSGNSDTLSAYHLELRSEPISGPILPLERHQLSLENGAARSDSRREPISQPPQVSPPWSGQW